MLLNISRLNPEPLYYQIVTQIRKKIITGELAPGEPLPSIRQLAEELTTSVITTKRAYLELEREGLVVTRQGSGSYVAGLDLEGIKAAKRRSAAELIERAIAAAREMGLSPEEVNQLLQELLTERGNAR